MSIQTFNRDQATDNLHSAVADKDKKRGEICMFYHRELKCMGFNNKELIGADMQNWRTLRKQNKLEMLESNNKNCKIKGRTYYILVIQTPNGRMGVDPTGMGWDNRSFLVDGYIYYFQKEINRDMVYKYVMGI